MRECVCMLVLGPLLSAAEERRRCQPRGEGERAGGRAVCVEFPSWTRRAVSQVSAPGNTVGGRLRSWAGGSHRITSHLALLRPRPGPGRVEFTRLSE